MSSLALITQAVSTTLISDCLRACQAAAAGRNRPIGLNCRRPCLQTGRLARACPNNEQKHIPSNTFAHFGKDNLLLLIISEEKQFTLRSTCQKRKGEFSLDPFKRSFPLSGDRFHCSTRPCVVSRANSFCFSMSSFKR